MNFQLKYFYKKKKQYLSILQFSHTKALGSKVNFVTYVKVN